MRIKTELGGEGGEAVPMAVCGWRDERRKALQRRAGKVNGGGGKWL